MILVAFTAHHTPNLTTCRGNTVILKVHNSTGILLHCHCYNEGGDQLFVHRTPQEDTGSRSEPGLFYVDVTQHFCSFRADDVNIPIGWASRANDMFVEDLNLAPISSSFSSYSMCLLSDLLPSKVQLFFYY
jgi:hypothetical protein